MFLENNPTEYTCKEDPEYSDEEAGGYRYTCPYGDSDCIENHIQNCNLYRTVYENPDCDEDGCVYDLGNGITCTLEY